MWAGSCEGHAVICLASCARNAPHLAVIKAVNYQQCSQSLQHSPRLPAPSPPPLHCHLKRSLLIQHSIERTVVSNNFICGLSIKQIFDTYFSAFFTLSPILFIETVLWSKLFDVELSTKISVVDVSPSSKFHKTCILWIHKK